MGKDKGPKGLEMLRLYRPPRQGALLLACSKCQRKLLESGRGRQLQRISEAMDDRAAKSATQMPLRMMETGCMKLCPTDGVTLCALRAGEFFPPLPTAVHSAAEVEAFFAAEIAPAALPPRAPAAEVVSEAGLEPATVSLEG